MRNSIKVKDYKMFSILIWYFITAWRVQIVFRAKREKRKRTVLLLQSFFAISAVIILHPRKRLNRQRRDEAKLTSHTISWSLDRNYNKINFSLKISFSLCKLSYLKRSFFPQNLKFTMFRKKSSLIFVNHSCWIHAFPFCVFFFFARYKSGKYIYATIVTNSQQSNNYVISFNNIRKCMRKFILFAIFL